METIALSIVREQSMKRIDVRGSVIAKCNDDVAIAHTSSLRRTVRFDVDDKDTTCVR